MSKQHSMMIVSIQSEPVSELTFAELCSIYPISPRFVEELIEYGVINPLGGDAESWVFSNLDVRRIRTVLSLQDDLEVNIAGAALVLELMDELEVLRLRLEVLEKRPY